MAAAFTSFSSDTAQLAFLKQTAEANRLAQGNDWCLKTSVCVSKDPDHRWRRCVLLEQAKTYDRHHPWPEAIKPDPQNEFINRLRHDVIQSGTDEFLGIGLLSQSTTTPASSSSLLTKAKSTSTKKTQPHLLKQSRLPQNPSVFRHSLMTRKSNRRRRSVDSWRKSD